MDNVFKEIHITGDDQEQVEDAFQRFLTIQTVYVSDLCNICATFFFFQFWSDNMLNKKNVHVINPY